MKTAAFADELDRLDPVRAPQLAARWGLAPGVADLLPRACAWARAWGTDRVSVVGFTRGAEPHGSRRWPAAVVDALGRMAAVAAGCGCRRTRTLPPLASNSLRNLRALRRLLDGQPGTGG